MADFPHPFPGPTSITGGGVYDPFIENTFESGDEQAVAQFTKPRRKEMTLSWDLLTLAQLDTLIAHRETTRNAKFTWIHPVTGVSKTCRYTSDGMTWDESAEKKGYYQAKAVMKEIV